jgi:aminoglycoside 6-adenylyltransferase
MSRTDREAADGQAELASMDDLEARLVGWAKERPDVRTVLVVGSRARVEQPADEWSDLDVAFTTTRTASYLATTGWLSEIGEVWMAFADPHGVTRHVMFAGGLDAGIAPLPHRALRMLVLVLEVRARLPKLQRVVPKRVAGAIDQQVDDVSSYCGRGARLLLDKDGLGGRLLAALPGETRRARLPTSEQFAAVVHEFWFLTVWNAKHLRRGEVWTAKTVACDGRMKTLLLQMIEWYTRAVNGADYDTWENGRHLEQWADPRITEDLRTTFGHYDSEDLWRASLATSELFRALATETARLLDLPYPNRADLHASSWVAECASNR